MTPTIHPGAPVTRIARSAVQRVAFAALAVLGSVTVLGPQLQAQATPSQSTAPSATQSAPASTQSLPQTSQPLTPMPLAPSADAPPLPTTSSSAKPSIAGTDAPPTLIAPPSLPQMPVPQGTPVDAIVAIVNGDLILDSDIDQERRFATLLPYGEASGTYTRARALERLINRDLILQQVKLQPQDPITEEDAAKDLDSLRKAIPECKAFHCETQAGWNKFLASQGFTEATLTGLWQQRMVVLQFIEQRFRMGIKITDPEIQDYYTQQLLPQYAKLNAPSPPLAAISSRIQEILLQQQVSNLLKGWLQSLRAQGSVVILHPGEEAP